MLCKIHLHVCFAIYEPAKSFKRCFYDFMKASIQLQGRSDHFQGGGGAYCGVAELSRKSGFPLTRFSMGAVSAHHSLTRPCGPKPRQWKSILMLGFH